MRVRVRVRVKVRVRVMARVTELRPRQQRRSAELLAELRPDLLRLRVRHAVGRAPLPLG